MATLLRAEGAAILALQDGDVRTLFSYRVDDTLAWRDVLGEDALQRALVDRAGFTTAIPAELWGESVAYALLTPITSTGPDRGVLCALRHGIPFDAVELVAGEAAARLLSMAFADAQAAALGERDGTTEAARVVPQAGTRRDLPLPPMLRVAIVESQPAMRLGLEAILERAGLAVAISCATVTEAIARMPGARCDVALVGTLADAIGSDAVARLRERSRVEVVVMTEARRGSDGHAALRAGASGHLARDAAPAKIVAALHAAAAGLAAVDVSMLDALLRASADPDERADRTDLVESVSDAPVEREAPAPAETERGARRASEALSPRERELLRYLAEGYTNKEIARVMVLADDTVKKGVQSLIAKLGAADRTHAVVLALRSGLIE